MGTCNARNEEEATMIFAEMKNLPLEKFLEIYRVLPM
jgi:hypothetical protein